MSAIEVKNVTVAYKTGDFATLGLKDVIINKIKGTYKASMFEAVKNVSFSLEKGELLGIIGTNGAGKSTLLKVLSGIMQPTEGTVKVEGNIASLLELASGFDGDLTVKENTFLRGAMLGYTKQYMIDTYRQILEFSELAEYENRLFRQLSSGMKSRLAFSIACLVKPEILILDEVLSVGDGAFRQKSEKKMLEIINGGATTLLVSHSLSQIQRMSTKVLWLDHGKMIDFGNTNEICKKYSDFLAKK